MKTRGWNPPSLRFDTTRMEDGGWDTRSVLKQRGSPLPLSGAAHICWRVQSARGLAQFKTWRIFGALLALFAITISVSAQTYSIDWHKIAGGGGTSTNGQYSVSGTIGQPDASGAMTGGNYSLTGGFWSMIAAVQTSGAPLLTITRSGASVIVSWQSSPTGWTLQQNINGLNPADWSDVTETIQDNGTAKTLTVNPPSGNRFYRLFKP